MSKLVPLALVALTVFAQKPKAEITEIRATGCVRRVPDSNCLLLETLDGGAIYSFAVSPKPDLDAVITIQGKAHEGRAACRQGIAIDVADWEPTGDRCQAPPSKSK